MNGSGKMTETFLWIYCAISTIANIVFFYLFCAAAKEACKLSSENSELIVEISRLRERVYSK